MLEPSRHRQAILRAALVGVLAVTTLSTTPASATNTAAAITLTKTVNGTTFKRDEKPVYTIVVRNTGDIDLTNGTVSDPLPIGLTKPVNVSASFDGGVTGTIGLPPTLFTNLVIPVGSAITIMLTPTVDIAAVIGAQITNTASVSMPQLSSSLVASATFTVGAGSSGTNPAATVTKTVNGTAFRRGERPVYTIVVRNTGDTLLSGGTISDALPTVFVALINIGVAFTSGATGTIGTQPVLLSNVSLPLGSAMTVTLTPTLGSSTIASTTITNTVAVSMPQLAAPVSASATFVVAITYDKFRYLPMIRRN